MTTATALATRWLERDRRYSTRKENGRFRVMTEEEEVGIRVWRRKEIDGLPADERSAAWGILSRWSPPLSPR